MAPSFGVIFGLAFGFEGQLCHKTDTELSVIKKVSVGSAFSKLSLVIACPLSLISKADSWVGYHIPLNVCCWKVNLQAHYTKELDYQPLSLAQSCHLFHVASLHSVH